ncbi:hypothetical protein PCE1_001669 [Barthelona sp. PCE]
MVGKAQISQTSNESDPENIRRREAATAHRKKFNCCVGCLIYVCISALAFIPKHIRGSYAVFCILLVVFLVCYLKKTSAEAQVRRDHVSVVCDGTNTSPFVNAPRPTPAVAAIPVVTTAPEHNTEPQHHMEQAFNVVQPSFNSIEPVAPAPYYNPTQATPSYIYQPTITL